MKINIYSQILLPGVLNDIALLTDGARININNIHYDKDKNMVSILLKRKKIVGFKKKKPIYSTSEWMNCSVFIREIKTYEINYDPEINLSELNILMGISIDPDEIYISSAEEIHGKNLLEIKMKINIIDIELSDN